MLVLQGSSLSRRGSCMKRGWPRCLAAALFLASAVVFTAPASANTREQCYVLEGCYPAPPVSPPTTCNVYQFGIHQSISINGVLRGPGGTGVASGCVYWFTSWGHGSTTTDVLGAYSIQVPADTWVMLFATKNLMTWDSKVINHLQNPTQLTTSQDFRIEYLHWASASPNAITSSQDKTLTLSVYSSAPADLSRVLAHTDYGVLELTRDTSYPSSTWSRWTGPITIPQGTSQGRKYFSSCVLQTGAAGTCTSPGQAIVLSSLEKADLPYYAIDNSPPSLSSVFPNPRTNVTSLGQLFAVWSDSLTQVNSASLRMLVDGVEVQATRSGGMITASGSSIAAGIHRMRVEAQDIVGNSTFIEHEFTLVTLQAGSASAIIQDTTVAVNPSGSLPPPSNVVFRAPSASTGPFNLDVNASTFIGHGAFRRDLSFPQAEIVFMNETGVAKHVMASIPWTTASYNLSALARSPDPLTASFAAKSVSMPDVWVDVPTGYNTQGSTATLKKVTGSLGPATVSQQFLTNEILPGGIPIATSATIQTQVEITNTPAGFSVATLETNVTYNSEIDTGSQPALHHPLMSGDAFSSGPNFTCYGTNLASGAEDTGTSVPCVATGRALSRSESYLTLAGDSGIGLYANHRIYRDKNDPLYIAWHQIKTVTDDSPECHGGRRTQPRLRQVTSHITQAILDTDGYSAWNVVINDEGRWTNYPSATGTEEVSLSWGTNNSMKKGGSISGGVLMENAQPVSTVGPQTLGVTATSNALRALDERLVLGAAFKVPESKPQSPTIKIVSTENWRIDVNHSAC